MTRTARFASALVAVSAITTLAGCNPSGGGKAEAPPDMPAPGSNLNQTQMEAIRRSRMPPQGAGGRPGMGGGYAPSAPTAPTGK
ncbi:MAG: hypothetical protein ACOVT5_04245 [Armatimonadaceae bacterium]